MLTTTVYDEVAGEYYTRKATEFDGVGDPGDTVESLLGCVELEDEYYSEENDTTTLYFIAPVSLRGRLGFVCTADMENADISIEFPGRNANVDDCSVSIGYTVDGSTEDWEYCSHLVSDETVERLLRLWKGNHGYDK